MSAEIAPSFESAAVVSCQHPTSESLLGAVFSVIWQIAGTVCERFASRAIASADVGPAFHTACGCSCQTDHGRRHVSTRASPEIHRRCFAATCGFEKRAVMSSKSVLITLVVRCHTEGSS